MKLYASLFLTFAITYGILTAGAGHLSAQNDKHSVSVTTDADFAKTIRKGVVLVDFWATWCGPCKTQGPILEQVADELGGKVRIVKLDVDRNPATSQKYNVRYLPTLMVFVNGETRKTWVGLQNKETLVAALKELI